MSVLCEKNHCYERTANERNDAFCPFHKQCDQKERDRRAKFMAPWLFFCQLFLPKPPMPSAYKFVCGACEKPKMQATRPEMIKIIAHKTEDSQPMCNECLDKLMKE